MSRFLFGFAQLAFVGAAGVFAGPAFAQATSPASDTPAPTPGPGPGPAPSVTLPMLGMTGPLAANPHPTRLDAGPLGDIYVTGAVSGLGFVQDHEVPGDHSSRVDLSNGQVFVQKIDGPFQFFVQAGAYSLPSLGTAYVRAQDLVGMTYGIVPQAFVKIAPSSHFNIMVGKLPTLSGAEYTFTFENMNINRGLLWNQENAVNRGVQANVSAGPLTVSVSVNDGYYSNKYNWLSGLIALALSPRDTVTIVAMGNVGRTSRTSFATPLLQNNSQLYNLIYTHNAGPFTITPYLQYTHVPANPSLGIPVAASTYGAALLVNYSLTPEFSLAGRAEYIDSSGSTAAGTPSLLYGPGSNAWSLTVTPSWQRGVFFARAEMAYVRASNITAGFGFGPNFNRNSQARGAVEMGVIF
jgi:hypothetical protein